MFNSELTFTAISFMREILGGQPASGIQKLLGTVLITGYYHGAPIISKDTPPATNHIFITTRETFTLTIIHIPLFHSSIHHDYEEIHSI
jgi:hypothetical protein